MRRDKWQCRECGASIEGRNAHVHHKLPRALGGLDVDENLISLCSACHATKHANLHVGLSTRFLQATAVKLAKLFGGDDLKRFNSDRLGVALRYMGVKRLRPNQLEPIVAALSGDDILLISPTGSGKSLCFQVPALLAKSHSIVVSPLKALMVDQVVGLLRRNFPATFRKSDISALKAFLSRSDDTIRMPYDRRAQVVPRRTVYFATVNEDKFLQDVTGNRRYLPITLDERLTYSEEIGRKIFAQAWHRYTGGEQWWLNDDEEISAVANQDKHDGNSLIPMLEDAFAFDSDRRDLAVKPGIILEMLGFKGASMAANTTRLTSALRQLGIEHYGTSVHEQRHYAMPPVTNDYLRKYKLAIGETDD